MRKVFYALLGTVIVLVRGRPALRDNRCGGGLGGDNGPLPGWDGPSISDYAHLVPCLSNDQIDALEDE